MKSATLLALLTLCAGTCLAGVRDGLSEAELKKVDTFANIVPTKPQLEWQKYEMTAFFHFGMNTFTNREWGDGKEDPKLFNPTDLDCRQWVRAAKAAGMKLAILTAKHHDGFCLWPSKYTDHSVKSSPWKNGRGDVCKEFVQACKAEGIKVGMYLSPWDRHEATYGTDAYNDYFVNQINELFDNYGPIDEFWFDGACGEGPNGKKQEYDWDRYYATIRARNPNCVIAVSGPDVRWVGNEGGFARESEWSVVPAKAMDNEDVRKNFENFHFEGVDVDNMPPISKPQIDGMSKTLGSFKEMLAANHWVWYPAECDTSIRPGWFYHKGQDGQVKSLKTLLNIYDSSVGRNSVLLLNIPPNTEGKLHENDVKRLQEFGKALKDTFSRNLAKGLKRGVVKFNTIVAREDITKGQRVEKFHVEIKRKGSKDWETLVSSTTIGYKRILRVPETEVTDARIVIDDSRAEPNVYPIELYRAPVLP